jgi:secondary thiamine-phosphate synthase enzyme
MNWIQREITLPAKRRGFHLITDLIERELPELAHMSVGLLNIFIKHTSASLSINENADPTVRQDMEAHFNKMVPENAPYYRHTYEGPDDMPAHLKTTIIGSHLTIPVTDGQLNMGIWQGVYLCEHRDHAGGRTLVLTLNGD